MGVGDHSGLEADHGTADQFLVQLGEVGHGQGSLDMMVQVQFGRLMRMMGPAQLGGEEHVAVELVAVGAAGIVGDETRLDLGPVVASGGLAPVMGTLASEDLSLVLVLRPH